ncbi:hypothetical protein EJB05_21451, partial [Eragrostis curvula]
ATGSGGGRRPCCPARLVFLCRGPGEAGQPSRVPPRSFESSRRRDSEMSATEAAKSGGTAAPVRCQRIGCDATFTEDNNPEGSCQYHPSPIFHDGMKEWSCCKQKSHDFSLFLAIPGCATGKHTTEKPVTKAVSANRPKATPVQSSTQGVGADSCQRCRQGFFCSDHGSQPKVQKPAVTDDTNKEPVEKSSVPPPKKKLTLMNRGLVKTKDVENCTKRRITMIPLVTTIQWKCCDVHVKEFDEFMEIPPCAKGWHNADAA